MLVVEQGVVDRLGDRGRVTPVGERGIEVVGVLLAHEHRLAPALGRPVVLRPRRRSSGRPARARDAGEPERGAAEARNSGWGADQGRAPGHEHSSDGAVAQSGRIVAEAATLPRSPHSLSWARDGRCVRVPRMPELPDLVLYMEHLERRLLGATLVGSRVTSPNLLRTAIPPLEVAAGRSVQGLERVGKRLAIRLDGQLFLVFHLMIAGRFHWKPPGAKLPGKIGLGAFVLSTGTLVLTEAGSHRRASLHVVEGEAALGSLDPGGMEVLTASEEEFRSALGRENHTLKRALTDPRLLSGIGNAYSDEILHRARLSP